MAIVDTEDLQLGPLISRDSRCFLCWLNHVQDDRDPVLVSFSNDSYISIGSECLDRAKRFRANLTCLEERKGALRLVLLQQLGHCGFDGVGG